MKLYTSNTDFTEVYLKDDSYRLREISGEHSLTLNFDLPEFVEFPLGTYCEFQGQRYTLRKPQTFNKVNNAHYEYTLVMDSWQGVLSNIRFKELVSKKVKFDITAKPHEYLRLLVDNLNSFETGELWQVGGCLESSEKLIAFNHQSCYEALQSIAQAFETEWEITDKTIHLRKVEYNKSTPLPLSYGKGLGLKPNIRRTSEKMRITRLYVQGGERNIDFFKYGSRALLLPKDYQITYKGINYRTDPNGLYIERVEQTNFTNEDSLDLSNIYPKRVGTVTAVQEVPNGDNTLYDFIDNTIPDSLNFTECLMEGQKLSVIFESGMLAGREFDVNYRHDTRKFEIIQKDEDGRIMPDSIFKPAIGDKYAVFGMMLPKAYIEDRTTQSGASFDLLNEAVKYLYENEQDKFSFTNQLDGIWAKKNWVNVGGKLKLGGYVNFTDPAFAPNGSLIRIIRIKDFINNPENPEIELSNEIVTGGVSAVLNKVKQQEVVIETTKSQVIDYTKRRFRDVEETEKMIQKAFTKFGKGINPATIHTMQMIVGDKALQYRFVTSRTAPTEVSFGIHYDANARVITSPMAVLQHMTLGIDTLKPNRPASEYLFWDVLPFASGVLNDGSKAYYIYIKASKTAGTANLHLSEDVITMEQEAGYYYFLFGILNSEDEGTRGFTKMYGFVEITPSQITAQKFSSTDGSQFIELLPNRIKIVGDVTITDGNINQIKQSISPDLLSLENRVKAFSESIANQGEIYLRGTGRNRHAEPVLMINNQNVTGSTEYRGLKLFVINRQTLQVVEQHFYDVYGNTEHQNQLRDKLNSLSSDVLIALISRDAVNASEDMLQAMYRCGAGIEASKFTYRLPYALVGIPGIGKGAGIEVYTSTDSNAPFAEISTKIINGTPQGINTSAVGMLDSERQSRQTSINEAKSATEAYARAQAELARTLAIANADGKITEAEQRQINNATQKLQEAKTFAEQKVNAVQVGGRNLILSSDKFQAGFNNNGISPSITSEGYLQVTTIAGNGNWHTGWDINRRSLNPFFNENDDFIVILWVKRLSGTGKPTIYLSDRTGYLSLIGEVNSQVFTPIYQVGKWRDAYFAPHLGWSVTNGTFQISKWAVFKGNKLEDWKPAPEDVEQRIADVQSDLQTAINNAKALLQAEINNVNSITQKLSAKADFLSETKIDGNTVATGAMLVGNVLGGNAGVNGSGLASTDVRFWAGSGFANRANAPFRVLDDGTMHATNAHISGTINAGSGSIGGLIINQNSIGVERDEAKGDSVYLSKNKLLLSSYLYAGTIHEKERYCWLDSNSLTLNSGMNEIYIGTDRIEIKNIQNNKHLEITVDGIYRKKGTGFPFEKIL
ncbi:hypothetical protein CAPN008_01120 [Capnocytophaga canis]|uniref:interleukin-like EMT inducer domain-containing protein n=1 Tax=Capnocytophaga canis TaxID=1848903 RepID=UPI001ACE3487|nr:interleukin-like EMT inducer domain-containing protein [Capnocytophaga canis]GIM60062.1 hypothetical protein CAPN008_01120 [Capnocytophaga canis]